MLRRLINRCFIIYHYYRGLRIWQALQCLLTICHNPDLYSRRCRCRWRYTLWDQCACIDVSRDSFTVQSLWRTERRYMVYTSNETETSLSLNNSRVQATHFSVCVCVCAFVKQCNRQPHTVARCKRARSYSVYS